MISLARSIWVVVALSTVTVFGVLGIRTGTTVDADSPALEESFIAILGGSYQVSRTSGFPAYEALGAMVWSVGERTAVMWLSLFLTLLALGMLLRPTRALRSWLGFTSWALLAITPSVLSNASSVMETSLLLFATALLALLLTDARTPKAPLTLAFVLTGALLTTTRPDAILLVAATVISLLLIRRRPSSRELPMLGLSIGAVAGLVIVQIAANRFPFASAHATAEEPIRRVLRGIIGVFIAFGPIGALALLALLVSILVLAFRVVRTRSLMQATDTRLSPLDDQRFVVIWLAMTLVLYGLRFLILSDEVEYLVPVFVIMAVAIPRLADSAVRLFALITLAGVASTSVVSIALFQRADPWDRDPQLAVSIQKGGALQDLDLRDAAGVRNGVAYQEFLDLSLGDLAVAVEGGQYQVVPRDLWYVLRHRSWDWTYTARDGIVGCQQLTTGAVIPAWRVSQPAGTYPDISALRSNMLMDCAVAAEVTTDSVIPTQFGATQLAPAGVPLPR